MMSKLVEFYRGVGPDSRGRALSDLWALDDAGMESIHDFIQWMFPLPEPSRYNPAAPLLTAADRAIFADDPSMRANLERSFSRFLAFVGLELHGDRVGPAADFDRKSGVWLHPNHNWLRISRVIASMRLLGLPGRGRALLDFLEAERRAGRSRVAEGTFGYWREAAGPG